MFLIGHAAVGVLLASAAPHEPAVAFGVGWLSHYLADFIPHGDEAVGEWTEKGNEIGKLAMLVGIDAAIIAAVVALYFSAHGFTPWVLAAAIGSAVPDVMWGLEKVAKKKLFGRHQHFHHLNHNFFEVRMPLTIGLIGQFIVTAVIWWRIIK